MSYSENPNRIRVVLRGMTPLALICSIVAAPSLLHAQDNWSLENSIRRVLEVAPEVRMAESEVAAREGARRQAGAWPNPQVELRGDDKIGKDDGSGGSDLTQFVFSQPVPVSGRLGRQRDVATAELRRAEAALRHRKLMLEAETARRYHALQLAAAELDLAEQRLRFADEIQQVGRAREAAGELAMLERLRLDLIRESAQQFLAVAEGEYSEARSEFGAFLGLSVEDEWSVVPAEPYGPVPQLDTLRAAMPGHPALSAARYRIDAAHSTVRLARSGRVSDPVLRLFRERDNLAGRRQDVTGIGIGIELPLWDRNAGRIGEARAQYDHASAAIESLQRDLSSSLTQNHLHLNHLAEQGERFRTHILEPAESIFNLTRKSYVSGEAEILSLIDGTNTYFDANSRYLRLLRDTWLEAAELRLVAGLALVDTE